MRPPGTSSPEEFVATEFRSIEDAVRGIKESTYEIQTESRLAYSGLKREQNIAEILEKYAWLYNLETVRRVEDAYRAETELENEERLRRVYYYLLEGYVGQQTAPLENALVSFEAGATVEVDGESIPYYNVPLLIAGEHDFERRNRLREASLGVVEESNPRRLEILRTVLATLADGFGHDSYTAYNAEKKRIDYALHALAHGEPTFGDGGDLPGADGPLGGGDHGPEAGRDRQPPCLLHKPRAPVRRVLPQGQAPRSLRADTRDDGSRPRLAGQHPHRHRGACHQEPQGPLLRARPSGRGAPADQTRRRAGRLHGLLPRGRTRPALRQRGPRARLCRTRRLHEQRPHRDLQLPPRASHPQPGLAHQGGRPAGGGRRRGDLPRRAHETLLRAPVRSQARLRARFFRGPARGRAQPEALHLDAFERDPLRVRARELPERHGPRLLLCRLPARLDHGSDAQASPGKRLRGGLVRLPRSG